MPVFKYHVLPQPAPKVTSSDLEYFFQTVTDKGQTLRFPATAPVLNQTVAVVPKLDREASVGQNLSCRECPGRMNLALREVSASAG